MEVIPLYINVTSPPQQVLSVTRPRQEAKRKRGADDPLLKVP